MCVRKNRDSTIPSFILELRRAAQSGSLQRCLGKLVSVFCLSDHQVLGTVLRAGVSSKQDRQGCAPKSLRLVMPGYRASEWRLRSQTAQ